MFEYNKGMGNYLTAQYACADVATPQSINKPGFNFLLAPVQALNPGSVTFTGGTGQPALLFVISLALLLGWIFLNQQAFPIQGGNSWDGFEKSWWVSIVVGILQYLATMQLIFFAVRVPACEFMVNSAQEQVNPKSTRYALPASKQFLKGQQLLQPNLDLKFDFS